MHIDPYGWLILLPVAAAMLWLFKQPADHPVKQTWHVLLRAEATGLSMLTGAEIQQDTAEFRRRQSMLFWGLFSLCALGGAASFIAFVMSL